MFPETNPAPGYKTHPEHKVVVKQYNGHILIRADGTTIAQSTEALIVSETNHEPIYYLPFESLDENFLQDSARVTRCPFKGKARHWNIKIGTHEIDNALWAYEMPYDEALELAGLVAFYPNKVTIETKSA